jgi:hypothetical protein
LQCLKYFIHSCFSCIENLSICADAGHIKSEEEEQLLAEDGVESSATTGANKQTSEDDTKIPYSVYKLLHMSMNFFLCICLLMKSVLAVCSVSFFQPR